MSAAYIQKGGDAAPVAPSPPIVELLKLTGHILSGSYTLISRTTVGLLLSLLAPLSLLYSPIAYLLAPVVVLVQVLVDILVLTPYAIVASVARNVYPIYVFVGATALCTVAIGFAARLVATFVMHLLFAPPQRPRGTNREEEEVQFSAVEPKEKSAMRQATTSKTRVRKRVSIKEERER